MVAANIGKARQMF